MKEKKKMGRPDKRGLVGYVDRPVHNGCHNCQHYASDFEYPVWVAKEGSDAMIAYDLRGGAKLEKRLRCERHKFSVRRLAICKTWEPKT